MPGDYCCGERTIIATRAAVLHVDIIGVRAMVLAVFCRRRHDIPPLPSTRVQGAQVRILRNSQQCGTGGFLIPNPLKTRHSRAGRRDGTRRMYLTVNGKIPPSLCGQVMASGSRYKEFTISVENPVGKRQRNKALPLFPGRAVNLRKI